MHYPTHPSFTRTMTIHLHRVALVACLLSASAQHARADKSPFDWAFIRLDYARAEKAEQLQAFFERLHTLAQQASRDPLLAACFEINHKYSNLIGKEEPPRELTDRVLDLRQKFNAYYIEHYLSFYDILFVDVSGTVFHTLRKDIAPNRNLIDAEDDYSALSRCIRSKPQVEVFVDFSKVGPTAQPAAFFVEPVLEDGKLVGWLIFQCAINKLNSMFAWTNTLGATGETFLVNENGFMLTESNFEGASTILTKRLDDRNIQAKFTEQRGNRTVIDYRNRNAITSFQVVEFLQTRWLVVAKMDKDEVITEHFRQHRRYYGEKVLDSLPVCPTSPTNKAPTFSDNGIHRVDMDEFVRANNGERLGTFGVSTCTGFLLAYPGKFAYLAHISPKDSVYGATETDLVGRMIKKVTTFDVYPCDTHRIQFAIVSPHLNTVMSIVDKLLEEGILLSQVKVIHNANAESVAFDYDYGRDELRIAWRRDGHESTCNLQSLADTQSLEDIVQRIMESEEKPAKSSTNLLGNTNNEGSVRQSL